MLKVGKVAATSFLVGLGDKLACSGDTSISLSSVVFSGLDFSYCSPSSSSTWFFSTPTSGYSSYFDPTSSSSPTFDPSSSSSSFSSLPPTLEVGVSLGVRVYVSMEASLSMSMNLDQRTGIINLLKASTTIILMRPWWPRCWCFPSLTFWLMSLMDCRKMYGTTILWAKGNSTWNLSSWSNLKW